MIDELRDSLTRLDVPEPPTLAAIVERGRTRRRRQRRRLASVGVAAIAAGGVLALGLTGLHNTAPNTTTSKPSGPRTIRTAGFTLVSYANGRAKLTLTNSQVFDPPVLRRALANDGIPALVKTGVYCYSTPAPPDPSQVEVLSVRPRLTAPASFAPTKALLKLYRQHGLHPDLKTLLNHTATVINPAKMPAGTELAFDYAPGEHLLAVNLVYTNSHVCRRGSALDQ